MRAHGLPQSRGFPALGGFWGRRDENGALVGVKSYFKPGRQHLDGWHTLWYARTRAADRFVGTPVEGRLRAKTGTTSEVTSLGGYVTAANGEELVFAFIYNGTDRFRAREAIDAMGSTLASFTRF